MCMEIFGTIRNVSGTWQVLDDANHGPLNITSVTVVNPSSNLGYVEVGFPLCDKIGTFIVAPDETCARAGIAAGPSVGKDKAQIFFSQHGVPISPDTISNPSANFWLYGKMKAL